VVGIGARLHFQVHRQLRRIGQCPEELLCELVLEAARAAGMKSIGVNQNDKQLSADVVVRSLEFLDANVFDNLLQDGA